MSNGVSDFDPAPRLPTTAGERRILAVSAVVLLVLLAAELLRGFTVVKLSVLGIALAWVPLLMLHELGHALAGWLAGWRIQEIVIGFGRELAQFRVGGCLVRLRAAPVEGYVVPSPTDVRHARWKSAFIYAAGPGAELAVVGLLWVLMGERLTRPATELHWILLQSIAVAAAMGVIFNLLPLPSGGGVRDGLGILASLAVSDQAFQHHLARPFLSEAYRELHRERPAMALASVEQGLRAYPADPQLLGLAAVCQAALGNHEQARSELTRLLSGQSDRPQGVEVGLAIDAALVALMEHNLVEARARAEQAHSLAPEDPRILLVLGRVLLELGAHQQAYRTLMAGYKLCRDIDEEGQFVACLALVCQALGNRDFADRFFAASERVPLGPMLRRRVMTAHGP